MEKLEKSSTHGKLYEKQDQKNKKRAAFTF